MNRRLIDPFQSLQLPEIIEEYLDVGVSTCIAFNRRGTILAAGTRTGPVLLWDFDTRGVAKILNGLTTPVNGLSWSRNGRTLAAVCAGGELILWEVLTGTPIHQYQLPGRATNVSLSPREPHHAVVSLAEGPPVMVDITTGIQTPLPMLSEADLAGGKAGGAAGNAGSDDKPAGGPTTIATAVLNKRGDMILVGYSKAPGGVVVVLDTNTLGFIDVVKMPSAARVHALRLNRQGTFLLANCHDRTVRTFELGSRDGPAAAAAVKTGGALPTLPQVVEWLSTTEFKSAKAGASLLWGPRVGMLTPLREYSNAVDRCAWQDACFSADSEHVVTAAASKLSHHIFVWSRVHGNLERILEGPKEGMGGLAWHPLRSCVASVTQPTGKVYVWASAYAEHWAAFAPDFKELDENVEYCEQEDEFDWQTPGATGHHDRLVARELAGGAALAAGTPSHAQSNGGPGPASEVIDVLTVEPDWVFSSDEEDEPGDQLHHLPVAVQVDEHVAAAAEEHAGGSNGTGLEDVGVGRSTPSLGAVEDSGAGAMATDASELAPPGGADARFLGQEQLESNGMVLG